MGAYECQNSSDVCLSFHIVHRGSLYTILTGNLLAKRGDENVIEETIKAVTDAEAQADQIQADARSKASVITDDAEKKAAQIREETKAKVKAAVEKSEREAQEAGKAALAEVSRTSAIEVEKMKAEAGKHIPEAVDRVIDCILGGQ